MTVTPSSSPSFFPTPASGPLDAGSTNTGSTRERALVLGGGGSTGNAWLIGVIAGLYDAGLDVSTADLTIGTSAGSTAAAQLVGAAPNDLYADIVAAGPMPAPSAPPARPVMDHLARLREISASSSGPEDFRRRMGVEAIAKDVASDGSFSEMWRATVSSRFAARAWPEHRAVLMTAVDARTGEGVALGRDGGVEIVDAVAASCSSGLPYRIGDDLFIDGGYRRNENADLAAGCERVLVLSPLSGRTLQPLEWRFQLSAQVEELIASGSRVETILPPNDSEHLFGANAMNLALRPEAARVGHEQGTRLAESLAELWS